MQTIHRKLTGAALLGLMLLTANVTTAQTVVKETPVAPSAPVIEEQKTTTTTTEISK